MTLLIVGTGLVGSQIARLELEREDAKGEKPVIFDVNPRFEALSDIFDPNEVTVIQGDVLNVHDLYRTIKSFNITRIIHTAANPLLTIGAQKTPHNAIQLNVMGTANVLEAARLFDLERVVFTSSNVIVLYNTLGPFGLPVPSTIYASTKLACEHLGLNYCASYGLDFAALRFSAVIGPWRYGGGGGPTQRFKEMLEHSLKGEVVNFPAYPFEYVYSKDAALGCVLAAHAPKSSLKKRVYNISMGKVYSGDEVKTIVDAAIPGAKLQLSKESAKGKGMNDVKAADLTNSRDELGFTPQFQMKESVHDYLAWFKNRRQ